MMERLFSYLEAHRTRRVVEAIVVVWLLSLADLCFTLWAHFFTPFHEENPLARYFLGQNLIPGLILFKLTATAFAMTIFWRLRTYARAEMGLWFLVCLYVALTIRWGTYTNVMMASL